VLAAGNTNGGPALEQLCGAYWPPVYAFIRRQGHDSESACDLTQAFFARLLEKQDLKAARPDRGRFRFFLLASIKHFLANRRDWIRAKKRGGGAVLLPLKLENAERWYSCEPVDHSTPDKLFERRWALTTLERALSSLRREFEQAGKAEQFRKMKSLLTGDASTSDYAEIAGSLQMTEGALKVAVHRLRRRFRDAISTEILETLHNPADLEDELGFLLRVLRT
jgi:RNA polymerase sigma-70 factor (ECF subfamily)